jgi:nicotinic acid mononucleotide adenylyltransferase
MDKPEIQQAVKMIERRREIYRQKHVKTQEEQEVILLEKARRRAEAYEKNLEKQKQKRAAVGAKRGRPFKTAERMEHAMKSLEQLREIARLIGEDGVKL